MGNLPGSPPLVTETAHPRKETPETPMNHETPPIREPRFPLLSPNYPFWALRALWASVLPRWPPSGLRLWKTAIILQSLVPEKSVISNPILGLVVREVISVVSIPCSQKETAECPTLSLHPDSRHDITPRFLLRLLRILQACGAPDTLK